MYHRVTDQNLNNTPARVSEEKKSLLRLESN